MIVNTTPSDVQYFTSEQVGAPKMIGDSNGDMLNVLDACLLHGWGEQTATESVLADGLLTITFGLSHGFLQNQLVIITGLTDGTLNGKKRIASLTPNSITIKADNALSADGEAKVSLAPLDWQSLFGADDPLKRAYRSKIAGVQRVLFLDMSYPNPALYSSSQPVTRAMVTVCDDMQVLGVPIGDMTNNLNKKPANENGSLFWYQKRHSAPTTSVPPTASRWKVVGNGEFFYFIVGWSSHASLDGTLATDIFGFGKYADLSGGVIDNTFLSAVYNLNDRGSSLYTGQIGSAANSFLYLFNTTGLAEQWYRNPTRGLTLSSSASEATPFPNRFSDSLFTLPYKLYSTTASNPDIAGALYSLLFIESSISASNYDGKVIDDLLIVSTQSYYSTSASYMKSIGFYVGD